MRANQTIPILLFPVILLIVTPAPPSVNERKSWPPQVLPVSGSVSSVSHPAAPFFTSSLRVKGQMILDADDGNVGRAHVKIKPISLSHRHGYWTAVEKDENKYKHRENLRMSLTFIDICLNSQPEDSTAKL